MCLSKSDFKKPARLSGIWEMKFPNFAIIKVSKSLNFSTLDLLKFHIQFDSPAPVYRCNYATPHTAPRVKFLSRTWIPCECPGIFVNNLYLQVVGLEFSIFSSFKNSPYLKNLQLASPWNNNSEAKTPRLQSKPAWLLLFSLHITAVFKSVAFRWQRTRVSTQPN